MKKNLQNFNCAKIFQAVFSIFMLTFSPAFSDENQQNQLSENFKVPPNFAMEKPEFKAKIKVTSGTKKVQNQTIETDEDGLNAVFAYGKNTSADVSNVKISTKQNGSRGLYAAFGGKINARNVEISTLGEHCAAFATDMGGGTVSVSKGKAHTFGKGSPVLYCTGTINAKNLSGKAAASEIAVIEGKNSLLIENSDLTGGAGLDDEIPAGIMIYQSMSGDAETGTAFLTVKNSNLTNMADGPFIYSTNTKGVVNLSNTKITNKSGILLLVSGNDSKRGWGRNGFNGAQIELNAENQNLEGEIQVDKISSLKLNLKDKSSFKGFVDGAKNGTASINISKKAKAEFTADSYFDKFNDSDETFKNIKSNGNTIFYNKNNDENAYLHGKTILLDDGGKIAPVEYEKIETQKNPSDDSSLFQKQGRQIPPKDSKRPELTSKTGKLQVVKDKAILIDEENKSTILKLMENKGNKNKNPPEKPNENGFPGNLPMQMSGEQPMQKMQNPPSQPFENPPEKQDFGKNQNDSQPKPVTIEDLKKLSGHNVEVKGIQESDGSFTVFEISEK